jgi:diguanylate cyclase (GGDEF)-like protein
VGNAALVIATAHRRRTLGPTFDYSGVATLTLLVLSGPAAAIIAHAGAKLALATVRNDAGERPPWVKSAYNLAWGILGLAAGWATSRLIENESFHPVAAGAAWWLVNGLLVGPMIALAQGRAWRDGVRLALHNDGWLRTQEAVLVLFAVLAWRSSPILSGGVVLLVVGMAMTSRRLLREYDAAMLARQEADAAYQRAETEAIRARVDPLTGVANRHALLEVFAAPRDRPAVLIVDLDHFKQINDRYGHAAGDAALVEVSRAIGEALRAIDFCARLGGEEFCALLAEIGSDAELEFVAERVRQAIEAVRLIDYPLIRVTASVGGTRLTPGQSLADALLAADQATYRAKAAGRNRVHLHAA